MVARKAGRNLRGRDAGSRRALGGHRGEIDLWDDTRAPFRTTDQRGPGRTGAGTGAGAVEDLWGEGDAGSGAVLEDCGGRARVGERRRYQRRSEEHTSELQSPDHLVCRLLLEKKKTKSEYEDISHSMCCCY